MTEDEVHELAIRLADHETSDVFNMLRALDLLTDGEPIVAVVLAIGIHLQQAFSCFLEEIEPLYGQDAHRLLHDLMLIADHMAQRIKQDASGSTRH